MISGSDIVKVLNQVIFITLRDVNFCTWDFTHLRQFPMGEHSIKGTSMTTVNRAKNREMEDLLSDGDARLEFVINKMRGAGLRITPQRKFLIGFMLKNHGPFSAEDLYAILSKRKDVKSDLVTIYRSLDAFVQLGIVSKCDFDDGVSRFEIAHEGHHHHHLICKVCRVVRQIQNCSIDQELILPKKHGFTDITHKLEFFGICLKCQER